MVMLRKSLMHFKGENSCEEFLIKPNPPTRNRSIKNEKLKN